ncbi:MAG TPA: hypothetical protein VGK19_18325 [Capsulimonadaceae bacterium]|jgi:hypothetical protein
MSKPDGFPPYFPQTLDELNDYRANADRFLGRLTDNWQHNLAMFVNPRDVVVEDLANLTTNHLDPSRLRTLGTLPSEPLELFDDWLDAGVGPIRALFLLSLLRKPKKLNEPTIHGHSSGSRRETLFFANDDFLFSPTEWILRDLYIGSALNAMGTSWKQLELAMSDAFKNALPQGYLSSVKVMPTSGVLLLWKHELEYSIRLGNVATKVFDHADALSELLRSSSDTIWRSALMNLETDIDKLKYELAPLTMMYMSKQRMKLYRARRTSPIVNPVLLSIRDTIWHALEQKEQSPRDCPDIAETLYAQCHFPDKGKWSGLLWKFIADIVEHIPLILGLPDDYPPPSPGDVPNYCLTDQLIRERLKDR